MAEQIRPRGLPGPELCAHEPGEVCDMCDPRARRHEARQLASTVNRAKALHAKEHPKPRARLQGPKGSGPRVRWEQLQQATFKRDGYRCVRCGGRKPLHCHHRKLRSQGGKNELCNLCSLCFECHMWVHDHPFEAQLAGLIVPSWADSHNRGMFLHDGRLVLLDDDGAYSWEGFADERPEGSNRAPAAAD